MTLLLLSSLLLMTSYVPSILHLVVLPSSSHSSIYCTLLSQYCILYIIYCSYYCALVIYLLACILAYYLLAFPRLTLRGL